MSAPIQAVLRIASFIVLFAVGWTSRPALAAWPDSYEHRVKLLEALRYDMAWPGMIHDPDEVARRYKTSCKIRAGISCTYKKWQGDQGGELARAAKEFGRKCGSEPLSCTVVGWSKVVDSQGHFIQDAAKGKAAAKPSERPARTRVMPRVAVAG